MRIATDGLCLRTDLQISNPFMPGSPMLESVMRSMKNARMGRRRAIPL